jgi:hypothetical protein
MAVDDTARTEARVVWTTSSVAFVADFLRATLIVGKVYTVL